jgi:hypothetical protein
MEPEDSREYGDIPTLNGVPPDSPERIFRSGGLGRRRRMMVLIVALIGLASFASPLIRTDSPVLDRVRWSPLEIASEVYEGALPVRSDPQSRAVFLAVDVILGFGAVYLLLLLIGVAAVLFPREGLVGTAAALGGIAILCDGRRVRYYDLQDFIYGESYAFAGHAVHAGALALVLLGVLGLLLWISATKALDY